MKVVIAGANGFIGKALVARLTAGGHQVTRLVRTKSVSNQRLDAGEAAWNPTPEVFEVDLEALEGEDAVVHVGGIGVAEKRWTDKQKNLLWRSRVASTELLSKAISQLVARPKVFICASAIGFYGDRGDEILDESSTHGDGFLAELCVNWENECNYAAEAGVRVVNLRSGIVLGSGGGVLKQQVPMFRLCMGGVMGSGRQFMSWISLRDEVSAIVHALETNIEGPVNLVSPNPVRNEAYTKALGTALRRPTYIPVPRWMMSVPLGAELTDEVLLASQRVAPTKLLDADFTFEDTDLGETFQSIFDEEEQARIDKKQSEQAEESRLHGRKRRRLRRR